MNKWLNKKTVRPREISIRGDPPSPTSPQEASWLPWKAGPRAKVFFLFRLGPCLGVLFPSKPRRMTHGDFCGQSPLVTRVSPPVLQAGGFWIDVSEMAGKGRGFLSACVTRGWMLSPSNQRTGDRQSLVVTVREETLPAQTVDPRSSPAN